MLHIQRVACVGRVVVVSPFWRDRPDHPRISGSRKAARPMADAMSAEDGACGLDSSATPRAYSAMAAAISAAQPMIAVHRRIPAFYVRSRLQTSRPVQTQGRSTRRRSLGHDSRCTGVARPSVVVRGELLGDPAHMPTPSRLSVSLGLVRDIASHGCRLGISSGLRPSRQALERSSKACPPIAGTVTDAGSCPAIGRR